MVRLRLGSSSSGRRSGRVGGTIGFALFALFGLLFLLALGYAIVSQVTVNRWPGVTAQIEHSRIIEDRDRDEPYRLEVRYTYEVDGTGYTGQRLHQEEQWTRDYREVVELEQQFPAGAQATAYYDPADPAESVLIRPGLSEVLFLAAFMLVPLVFLVIGVGGLYMTWRRPPPKSESPAVTTGIGAGAARHGGVIAAAVISGMFLIIGSAITVPMVVLPAWRSWQAQDWPQIEATVIDSQLLVSRGDSGSTYAVGIEFEYEVGGQTYRSSRYDFTTGYSSGRSAKQAIVNAHPAGTEVEAHVNPDDPWDAVIEPGVQDLGLKSIFLVFPLIGLVGTIAVVLHLLGVVQFIGTRRSPAAAATAEERPTGPVTLKPRKSRLGGFVSLLVFTVFWNGFTWLAVVPNVSIWFAGIFVLVGIAVGGGAVYQGLRLFNPTVELEVEPGFARLGDTINVRWNLRGSTGRLHDLSIRLEGWEEVEYRQGTRTVSDKHRFAAFTIAEPASPSEIERGEGLLTIPADAMHSFHAARNRIVWVLHAHGHIRFWPDLNQSFELTVHPREVGHG